MFEFLNLTYKMFTTCYYLLQSILLSQSLMIKWWFYCDFIRINSGRIPGSFNLLSRTGYAMHQQFNIQQLYALPTPYLCVLYLSENKQRLVPLTAQTDWFL